MSDINNLKALERAWGQPSVPRPPAPRPPSSFTGYPMGQGAIPKSVAAYTPPIPLGNPAVNALVKVGSFVGGVGKGVILGIAEQLLFPEATGDPEFSRKNSPNQYTLPQETHDSKGNPPFQGGQTVGTTYGAVLSFDVWFNGSFSYSVVRNGPYAYLVGPITKFEFNPPTGNVAQLVKVIIANASGEQSFNVGNTGGGTEWRNPRRELLVYGGAPDNGSSLPSVGGKTWERETPRSFNIPTYDPIAPTTTPETPTAPSSDPTKEKDKKNNPNPRYPSSPNPTNPDTPQAPPTTSPTTTPTKNPASPSPSNPNPVPTNPTSPKPNLTPQSKPTNNPNPNPDRIRNPDPYKEPDRLPAIPPTPAPPVTDPLITEALNTLKTKSDENKILLLGIPALIPPALVNDTNFQDSVKNSSKAGTCEASAPDGCVDNAVKRNTDNVTQNINAKDVENKGILASILANFAGITAQLVTVLAKIKTLAESTVFTSAINTLTFITTVHNAAMLSRDIGTTLIDAVGNGLTIFGLKLKNADTGADISLSDAIGQQTANLFKNMLGVATYTELTTKWATANRIYQAGMNVLSTTQSLLDSARSLNELTGNNVGKIGNALKFNGLLRENEFPMMNENNTQASTIMAKLEAAQNAVGVVSSITGEVLSVTEQVTELKKNRDDFTASIEFNEPKEERANVPIRQAIEVSKAASAWEWTDFSLVKSTEEEIPN